MRSSDLVFRLFRCRSQLAKSVLGYGLNAHGEPYGFRCKNIGIRVPELVSSFWLMIQKQV